MGSTRYIMSIGELTRKDNSLCFRKNGRNVYIPVENTKEIYKIIEEIEKRYNQDLTLEIIAEQFHFHPNSLTRYFK